MSQELLFVAGITAFVSSLLTLLFAYLLFRIVLLDRLYQELDELSVTLKERLREGVLEAGRELKPEFRDEVRDGFKEALTGVMSGDLIEETAKRVAQNSSNIVEQGLGILFGKRNPEGRK